MTYSPHQSAIGNRKSAISLLLLSLLALAPLGTPLPAHAQDTPAIAATNALTKTEQRELERKRRQAEIARLEAEQSQRRGEISEREARLAEQRSGNATSRLRELLGAIDENDPRPMEEIARLRTAAENLREERTRPEKRLELLHKRGEAPDREQVELTERLVNLNENIQLHRLLINRWIARSTLGMEADRLDKVITGLPVNPRPSVRLLAEKRRNGNAEHTRLTELDANMAELAAVRSDIAPALELLENKSAQLAETIQLLGDKYDLTRTREVRDQLDTEKSRQDPYAERLEILKNQVGAIDETLAENTRLCDLYRTALVVLDEDLDAIVHDYWRSVLVPLASIAVLFTCYFIISRLFLPRVYKRDRLFVARRVGLYVSIMLMIGVILGFFFDDLRPFATTLGIAGAAVVIALQDLCSSFAGWFVIIASRKIHVGDRIEVDGKIGDVLDLQLLRTTVLELRSGLGVDEPTGRVIVIPNSFIFKGSFINFNHVHPYIWNKIDITITYETPFRDAEALLKRILEEETRLDFEAARAGAGKMEKAYGVADTEYVPKMYSTIADNGVLFRLLYVGHYRRVDDVRNRLNTRILREFDADKRMQLAYPTQRQLNG